MGKSRKRKKSKIRFSLRSFCIVTGIVSFLGAFAYYFTGNFHVAEMEYAVYSSMSEPELPLIYAMTDDYDINPMHGYMQEMDNAAAGDLITPIPEDRKLKLRISMSSGSVAGISYEIRSLDMEHFIENTALTAYTEEENGDIIAELPIQNLIERDTPYLLKLILDLSERTVNYYTRIIWQKNDKLGNMIRTASDFTHNTFDYEDTRDLTVYMETDPGADNSTLASANIKSSFSNITWGGMDMKLYSEPIISVREYDGIMSAIEVSYISECVNEAGNTEHYNNVDEYTLRAGNDRVYMMNFDRQTRQIFEGNRYLFTGNRISLGITDTDSLETRFSENRRYIAFKSGRELWIYDQDKEDAVNAFSFRSEKDTVRGGYDKHDIKIISMSDDGVMDFIVYGYMNRDRHEGYNGIVYYRYDSNTRITSELFFIPRTETFEKIKAEIDEMSVKSGNNMFYLKQSDRITAIDLTSLEMMDIVTDITENRYAISKSQTRIAWTEGYMERGNVIRLLDINKGTTGSINAEADEILSVIEYYGEDLIYGTSNANDAWIVNGYMRSLPVKSIKIVNPDLNDMMEYGKEGLHYSEISIENNRIKLTQYTKNGDGTYNFAGSDTIVSSTTLEDSSLEGITDDNSTIKKQVYYLNLDKTIRTTRNLNVGVPESISYEGSGTIELARSSASSKIKYFAYANGRLKGITYSLGDAIDYIYDDMGWVRDMNGAVVYSRADRVSTFTIREPAAAALPMILEFENGFTEDVITDSGYIVMNAADIPLNRLLYYVNKGNPVAAVGENGRCLIYGYNSNEIFVYYPAEDEEISRTEELSNEDAALYFNRYGNDFVVFRKYPGR